MTENRSENDERLASAWQKQGQIYLTEQEILECQLLLWEMLRPGE